MAEPARKIDYLEYYDELENASVIQRKRPDLVLGAKKKKKSKLKFAFVYAAFAIILVCSSLIVLKNYTDITKLSVEINKTNKEIENLKKVQTDVKAKLEKLKSESDIVYEAQTKLGMVFPEDDQIVYFSIEKPQKEEINMFRVVFNALIGKVE